MGVKTVGEWKQYSVGTSSGERYIREEDIGMEIRTTQFEPNIVSNFFELLRLFETRLTQGIRELMISKGVAGDSDLVKSTDLGYSGDFFQLLSNDYFQWVSRGRSPRARKVPVRAIIQWIKDEGISYRGSINSAAFAIQQSIYKKGIRGKLFEEQTINFTLSEIENSSAEAVAAYGFWGTLREFRRFKGNQWVIIKVQFDSL